MRAVERVEQHGIVFLDELDKIVGRSEVRGPDVSREGVQRDLLPLVEGCTISTKYGMIKTDHILFIASGAFHLVKPSDLIPELQGRFPIRVELQPLTQADFVRIMTEPEWEFACRGGTTTIRHFGTTVDFLPLYEWFGINSINNHSMPPGSLRPNSFGIFDILGNVSEWCQDRYGRYGSKAALSDPMGHAQSKIRVMRGGYFGVKARSARSATRIASFPKDRSSLTGFRVARTCH